MNNIYVDELPKCCELCQMNCSKKHNFISCLITDCDSCIGGRPKGCPLKKLSDRLAEERKKVVQEIREQAKNEFEFIICDECYNTVDKDVYISSSALAKILDQIERNIDG